MSSWNGEEICNLQKKTASIGSVNAQIKYFSPYSSVRLQQPASTSSANPFTVEEALYVLGKNILGKNVTDRIFPVAKTIAKGVGQVGQGLSTFGELLPPVEFDGSPLKLLPGMHILVVFIFFYLHWVLVCMILTLQNSAKIVRR